MELYKFVEKKLQDHAKQCTCSWICSLLTLMWETWDDFLTSTVGRLCSSSIVSSSNLLAERTWGDFLRLTWCSTTGLGGASGALDLGGASGASGLAGLVSAVNTQRLAQACRHQCKRLSFN